MASTRTNRILINVLACVVVVLFALRVPLAVGRAFDTDEFEHMHGAWCLSQGQIIYRDFFEHHSPLFYYTLLPVFSFFVGKSALIAARICMLPFVIGIFVLLFGICRRLRGSNTAVMALFLLSSVVLFLQKSVEIRPDVPALMFLLIAIYGVMGANRRMSMYPIAGLAAGIALAFTPKTVFPLMGLGLAMLIVRSHRTWLAFFGFGFGLLTPMLGLIVWFLCQGTFRDALWYNVGFNAQIPYTYWWLNLQDSFFASFEANSMFWSLAIVALVVSVIRIWRKRDRITGAALVHESTLLSCTAFAILGICVIQVPLRQYVMVIVCLLAMLLAAAITDLGQQIEKHLRHVRSWQFMAVLVSGLLFQPVSDLYQEHGLDNEGQFEVLEYVWQVVPPDDYVFDCWTGLHVFRPHAFFYHFLNEDVLAALNRIDPNILNRDLLKALEETKPRVVIVDARFGTLPEVVQNYVRKHYRASNEYQFVLIRNAVVPAGTKSGTGISCPPLAREG